MIKRNSNPRKTFSFVFIASLLMIAADLLFGPRFYDPGEMAAGPPRPSVSGYEHSEVEDYEYTSKDQSVYDGPEPKIIDIPPNAPPARSGPLVITIPPDPASETAGPHIKQAEAVTKITQSPASLKIDDVKIKEMPRDEFVVPPDNGKAGKIVVIIDDMGMDRKRSMQVIDLQAPLTLAFLPYAPRLRDITAEAAAQGHTLMLHAPMQPMDVTLNPGPLALREDMTRADFERVFNLMLDSFDGYVAVNNHMGSRLTQNQEAMDWVMQALAKRDVMFVDSVTIPASVAAQTAADAGLRYAARDVFLDNRNDKNFVMQKLRQLESVARRKGVAIAIGHPKDATIEALREWLPTLAARNLTVVSIERAARQAPPLSGATVINGPDLFGPHSSGFGR
jgi:polysaccharide deacetylase 2 family uncharacterized protein YibQ